ncbi:MAG: hypothetical protein KDI30_07545, partial [Pseudomonadales bacterium]|nr:hypothetical protein [Pseudomonadales bacterium]
MTDADQYQPKIDGVDVKKFLKTATPITLKQWLETLPKSNPSALGNYLVQILKALDDVDMLPMSRFSLTDTIRPYAYSVVSALTQGFMGSQKGFSKEFQGIINQAMVLQGQLVASYSSQGNKARLMGEQQAFIMGSAMHRALADQYSMLSFYLKLALPVPQQIWRQVNRIYKMVEDARLQAHIMGDNVRLTEQMLTIKQMYTAILLLGSARSNMLPSEEVAVAAVGIKRWVLHADLAEKPALGQEHALAVDLDGADGAVFQEVTTVKPGVRKRYIHTTKLLAQLEKLRGQKLKIDDREVEIHNALIDHLTQSWGEYIERDNMRTERQDSVTVALGIGCVHFYLAGGVTPLELVGPSQSQAGAGLPQGKLVLGDTPEEFNFHPYLPADITTVDQEQ